MFLPLLRSISTCLRYGDIVRRSRHGVAEPVTTFTQFDIDSLLLEYHQVAPGKRADGALISVTNGVKTVQDVNIRRE